MMMKTNATTKKSTASTKATTKTSSKSAANSKSKSSASTLKLNDSTPKKAATKDTSKTSAVKGSTTKATTSKSAAANTSSQKSTPKKSATAQTGKEQKIRAKSSAADGLKELFIDGLKDIVYAERALLKAIPKMAKNASAPNLIKALESHLLETEGQVKRLEQIFEILGESNRGKKCDAIEGLIKEGEGIMEETEVGPVRDAGIIAAAQKIEHYEIASYGTLVAFAKTLKHQEVSKLLTQTLEEEKQADRTLTESAYNTINFDAAEEDQKS